MYAQVDELGQTCVLSQGDIEDKQKLISKAIDVASDKSHQHGKYNSYSPEQRAGIGKYAMEHIKKFAEICLLPAVWQILYLELFVNICFLLSHVKTL